MTNAVTIDNYDVKTHERYAVDQGAYETKYIDEANLIPRHFEIPGSKSSFASKWEELFEVHLGIHPWALFDSPPRFGNRRNRFFSYCISESFDWVEDTEEDEEEQKKEEKRQIEAYKRKIQKKKAKHLPLAIFERDQKALLSLFDSIESLNSLLRHVHARKLQYQKG
ncbi:MAG: hypothetical protein KR126chlam1_01248 [Chlamydiae bacterium]|nr:hypothetical protein [Chlamydiota bacterium]